MKRPDLSARNTKHGMSSLPEYNVWCGIKQRCYYEKHVSFSIYGGRGVRVCERWHDFANFYADMGPRPSAKHTVERLDSSKDYSPENCTWVTRAAQSRNTSRTRHISHAGETLCVEDWAKRLGVSAVTLRMRLHRGWSEQEALLGRVAA